MPRSFLFVLALLTVSLGLNVNLSWKVKELGSLVPKLPPNKVGVQLNSFSASDLEGHVANVSFNTGKSTLIYYVDPECHWCKANANSFRTLTKALAGKSRVIILSQRAATMDQFLAETHSPDPVLIIKSQKVIRDLGLSATPQTFFVNAAGRVEHHWLGAYIGNNSAEIQKTFGLHLPNVKSPS